MAVVAAEAIAFSWALAQSQAVTVWRSLYNDGNRIPGLGSYFDGYPDGFTANPGFTTPQLTVVSTFALDFATAHATPWTATLANWPAGGELVALMRRADRNEVIVIRDAAGAWCWPFDVEPDNAVNLAASPATIQLLPRGGWPPGRFEIQIAAAKMAQVA